VPAVEGQRSRPTDAAAAPPAGAPEGPSACGTGCASAGDGTSAADCSASVFALGATVRIVGLKAKPELNKALASVLGFDAVKQRFNVSVNATSTVLALRAANLEAVGRAAAASSSSTSGASEAAGSAPPHAAGSFWAEFEAGEPSAASVRVGADGASLSAVDTSGGAATSETTASAAHATKLLRLKDGLRQLKECLDEGLLSQEEFDAEKRLLLQAIRKAV